MPIRNSPYWLSLSKGRALGYRKGQRGGNWLARYRSQTGQRWQAILGPADDSMDSESNAVLTFEQAQVKAREWFGDIEANSGQRLGPYTVGQALDDYIEGFQGKSKKKTSWTVERYIRSQLGGYQARSLSTEIISKFHHDIASAQAGFRPRRSGERILRASNDTDLRARRASANRVLTVLKAALNRAFYMGKIATDLPWRRVKPFPKTDSPRIRYLDEAEAKRLVNAASNHFRPLIQAALLTGGRWSEIHRIKAGDFDARAGAVFFPETKSGRPRWVHLTDEGIAFFRRHCAGKGKEDFLFLNEHGRPYGHAHQIRPMKLACGSAKIEPSIGFHILRHTYGSRLAMNGVPLAVIAEALGHADERITRKHYAHLSPSYVRDAVRKGLGTMGIYNDDGLSFLGAA